MSSKSCGKVIEGLLDELTAPVVISRRALSLGDIVHGVVFLVA